MLRHSDSSHPRRVFLRAQGRAGGWQLGDLHGRPAPQRVQDPVGLIGCVQVVVKEPAHGLPLLSLGVITRGARGRIAADEVVEAELAIGGPGQQVTIEQGDEGLLRLGDAAAVQGGRGRRAETSARADAQPPEEPLVVGFQRTVGQVEGGCYLPGSRPLLGSPRRRRPATRGTATAPRSGRPGSPVRSA